MPFFAKSTWLTCLDGEKIILGIWETFFSDLGHFSGFGDFSRFGDFGCLKHITKAQHLLSSHSGNEGKADAVFITKTCKW